MAQTSHCGDMTPKFTSTHHHVSGKFRLSAMRGNSIRFIEQGVYAKPLEPFLNQPTSPQPRGWHHICVLPKMKSPLIQLCTCVIAILPVVAGEGDPFAKPGEVRGPSESDPRMVTEAGRKTLEILRNEKIASAKISGRIGKCIEQGFEVVRDRLAKHGIEVRLKKSAPRNIDRGDPLSSDPSDSKSESGEESFLRVEDVSIEKFMQMLDRWAVAGWILYPDGSITYFDSQCCGRWPKDGIYCHDSQYEEGKPEVMKAASEKRKAEQVVPPNGP